MNEKKPIVFIIPSFRSGGAERVASLLINQWTSDNHPITVITFDDPSHDFFMLSPKVRREQLGHFVAKKGARKAIALLKAIPRIRGYLKKSPPSLVISFMTSMNLCVLLACLGIKQHTIVVSERTYTPFYYGGILYKWLIQHLYQRANYVVTQTEKTAQWFHTFLSRQRVAIIPNPLTPCDKIPPYENRTKSFLAVGRLVYEKGYDRLFRAYHTYTHTTPHPWPLIIIGSGPEEVPLKELASQLGIQSLVTFAGTQAPENQMTNSRIFLMTSLVEGYPNTLLEAMSHGMTVISYNCDTGPQDLIKHRENGILVSSQAELLQAMITCSQDEAFAQELANAATHVNKHHSIKTIAKRWLTLTKPAILERH